MKQEIRQAFSREMAMARSLVLQGDLDKACAHLERAHVIGQRHIVPHVQSHWHMLRIGLKRRSMTEVLGQAVRIVLGALGSTVSIVPVGNTGGTNISMFARLPIQADLKGIVE